MAALQVTAPDAGIPAEPGVDDVFEIVPVANGVWAAEVKDSPAAYAFANSLVVRGAEGVLVVDTQQSSLAARALIAWIRDEIGRPVRWVVNTHWHGDHVYGNEAYRRAFPEVRIVGHEATRAGVLGEGAARRHEELERLPASLEERRRWLETGTGPEGEALTPEDRAAVSRSLALREAYLDDLSSLRVLPPDVVFTERLTLHLGDRRVELVHLGPAHTAGDVVVHLPGEGVVAVGDLLEQGPPWLDGAFVPGWADALARLREISPTRVLPAHGRLQGDTRLLDWQAEFFGALVDGAREALEEGLEAEEAVARTGLDRYREQFASVGVAGDALDRWLVQAMEEAMADVAGDGG